MDSKCRGQLQALLAGLEAQNTRGGNVNVCKIEDNMTEFMKKLQSYMLSTTLMAENLKACQEEKTKLNNTVSNLNSELSKERAVIESQRSELDKYRKLDTEVIELRQELDKSQDAVSAYKQDIEQFETRCEQLNKRISDLNHRTSDKDSQIEKLKENIKLDAENERILTEDLKSEKDKSQSLSEQIEKLKIEHREEMEKYQLEMNEKLIKAQTRIAQQSAANSDAVSGGMDYKELFKRKMAIIESKHQKEINELRKTISRLQTQRR